MKNLTYDAYVTDPVVREQVEREVRRLHAEAAQRCFATIFRAIVRRAPVLKLKTA